MKAVVRSTYSAVIKSNTAHCNTSIITNNTLPATVNSKANFAIDAISAIITINSAHYKHYILTTSK